MEDRIQINGIWYVKEENKVQSPQNTPDLYDDYFTTFYEGAIWEDSNVLLEFSVLKPSKNEELEYDTISLKVVNKQTKEEEYWDNINFLLGIAKEEKIWIKSLNDSKLISSEYKKVIEYFLNDLYSEGYLSEENSMQ